MRRNSRYTKRSLLLKAIESFKESNITNNDIDNNLNNELFAKTFNKNLNRNSSLKIFSYNQKKFIQYSNNNSHKSNYVFINLNFIFRYK